GVASQIRRVSWNLPYWDFDARGAVLPSDSTGALFEVPDGASFSLYVLDDGAAAIQGGKYNRFARMEPDRASRPPGSPGTVRISSTSNPRPPPGPAGSAPASDANAPSMSRRTCFSRCSECSTDANSRLLAIRFERSPATISCLR